MGCLLLVASAASASPRAADFRAASWGDSPEVVRAGETAEFHHQGNDEIAYVDGSIEGISGGILYLFEDGRLVRGLYVSRDDYERLREHLDELLGTSGEEQRRWIGGAPGGEAADPIRAIVSGRLRLANVWTLETTQVSLIMTGKDGGVFLRAVFQPRS